MQFEELVGQPDSVQTVFHVLIPNENDILRNVTCKDSVSSAGIHFYRGQSHCVSVTLLLGVKCVIREDSSEAESDHRHNRMSISRCIRGKYSSVYSAK